MPSSPLISVAELAARLKTPGLVVLDVRDAGDALFLAGHIPGARDLSFSRTVCGPQTASIGRCPLPGRAELAPALGALGVCAASSIVIYGNRDFRFAARTWFTLRWLGLEDVRVLDGNFFAWEQAGLPVSTKAEQPAPVDLAPGDPLERVFSADEIEGDLDGGQAFTLLDGRPMAAFAAGRIPGSLCRTSDDNIDESGLLKPAQSLRTEILQALDGRPAESVVHTCAAGVRATVNLLACKVAGLPAAGVYIGSFSEWIKDPDHPVATGL